MFTAMLADASREDNDGIYIKCRNCEGTSLKAAYIGQCLEDRLMQTRDMSLFNTFSPRCKTGTLFLTLMINI